MITFLANVAAVFGALAVALIAGLVFKRLLTVKVWFWMANIAVFVIVLGAELLFLKWQQAERAAQESPWLGVTRYEPEFKNYVVHTEASVE